MASLPGSAAPVPWEVRMVRLARRWGVTPMEAERLADTPDGLRWALLSETADEYERATGGA